MPLFGNTLSSFTKDIRENDLNRIKNYGPVYGLYIGTIPILTICDADIVKAICFTESQNFTDTNAFRSTVRFFKDSFILKKGNEWKMGRSLVSPVFTSKRIKDIYPQIKKAAIPFFENVENLMREGKKDEIDVKKFTKGFSLDVVAKFVFAFELNSAKDMNHPFVFNARNLTNFKMWKMAIFSILPTFVMELFNIQIIDQVSVDYMGDLVKTLVKQRRENKDVKYNDFLDLLVNRIDENNLNVTMDEIVSHCIVCIKFSVHWID